MFALSDSVASVLDPRSIPTRSLAACVASWTSTGTLIYQRLANRARRSCSRSWRLPAMGDAAKLAFAAKDESAVAQLLGLVIKRHPGERTTGAIRFAPTQPRLTVLFARGIVLLESCCAVCECKSRPSLVMPRVSRSRSCQLSHRRPSLTAWSEPRCNSSRQICRRLRFETPAMLVLDPVSVGDLHRRLINSRIWPRRASLRDAAPYLLTDKSGGFMARLGKWGQRCDGDDCFAAAGNGGGGVLFRSADANKPSLVPVVPSE
jgi:hypothetical protein